MSNQQSTSVAPSVPSLTDLRVKFHIDAEAGAILALQYGEPAAKKLRRSRHSSIQDLLFAYLQATSAAQTAIAYAARLEEQTRWPSCPLHGPHDAAENGAPVSFCTRCEDR